MANVATCRAMFRLLVIAFAIFANTSTTAGVPPVIFISHRWFCWRPSTYLQNLLKTVSEGACPKHLNGRLSVLICVSSDGCCLAILHNIIDTLSPSCKTSTQLLFALRRVCRITSAGVTEDKKNWHLTHWWTVQRKIFHVAVQGEAKLWCKICFSLLTMSGQTRIV